MHSLAIYLQLILYQLLKVSIDIQHIATHMVYVACVVLGSNFEIKWMDLYLKFIIP